MNIFVGIFLVLHGLVHMWYVTLSQGWVAFEAEMGWSGNSWLLSSFLPEEVVGWLATICFSAAAAGFVVAGMGKVLQQDWTWTFILVSATFSVLTMLVFWDGGLAKIVEKGLLGFVVNLALIAYVMWP